MPAPPLFLRKLGRAVQYAWAGIAYHFSHERNAQIHLGAMALLVAAGVLLHLTAGEWAILLLAMTLVLSMETMNTAVERLTDLVSPGPHRLAKLAKDCAAGAVLITSIGVGVVALLILIPALLRRIR